MNQNLPQDLDRESLSQRSRIRTGIDFFAQALMAGSVNYQSCPSLLPQI
ncbi:MAG: hypothetical protein V7K57_07615 [Nostoc sp.]